MLCVLQKGWFKRDGIKKTTPKIAQNNNIPLAAKLDRVWEPMFEQCCDRLVALVWQCGPDTNNLCAAFWDLAQLSLCFLPCRHLTIHGIKQTILRTILDSKRFFAILFQQKLNGRPVCCFQQHVDLIQHDTSTVLQPKPMKIHQQTLWGPDDAMCARCKSQRNISCYGCSMLLRLETVEDTCNLCLNSTTKVFGDM